MGTILLTVDEAFDRKASFLLAQFNSGLTGRQIVFDVFFGGVAPILCFIADPIVFSSWFSGDEGILSSYSLFAYLVSAIAIAALVVWLLLAEHLEEFGPMFAGIFGFGFLFSGIIGLVIFPFSFVGMILLIGAAGFTPFVTGFVYLRNSVKAFRQSRLGDGAKTAIAVASVGIAIGLPALFSYWVSSEIRGAVEGDLVDARVAIQRLQWIPVLPEATLNPVVKAYEFENNEEKKAALKKLYAMTTGENIDDRLRTLAD